MSTIADSATNNSSGALGQLHLPWDDFYDAQHPSDVTEYMGVSYSDMAEYFDPGFLGFTSSEVRVLIVGCGLSSLGEDLYDAYGGRLQELVCVDISEPSVEGLRQRSALGTKIGVHRPRMSFAVKDMTRSDFPLGAFDVVIDKGVLDENLAYCSGESDEPGERNACALLWGSRRVLNSQRGVYLIASVHEPARMNVFLAASALGFTAVDHFDIKNRFLYVCRTSGLPAAAVSSSSSFDDASSSFEAFVADVLRRKYTEVMPLLTSARADAVRRVFAATAVEPVPPPEAVGDAALLLATKGGGTGGGVQRPACEVYVEVFTAEERDEYSLDDFLADITAFSAAAQRGGAESTNVAAAGATISTTASVIVPKDYPLSCETMLDFLKSEQ